ncbi:MAG: hypothetical protein K2X00_03480 [Nitrospiraceae bacterium]|nr:hypothetical protein [Nitrospiraceae bacterium]
MAVSALTAFDPSKFFQTPAANAAGAQRLDTKVSAISASTDLTGQLSVTTAEGDKITLTADFEARYRAVNYQAKAETEQGTVEVKATSIEASLKKQYGVTVEGDLNEQELHDLEKLFRKVSNIFRKYFRGQDDEALAKTAKLADKFGGLSSLSSLDLSINVERSVTVVAAQVASAVTGQPALPEHQPAQAPTSTQTSRIPSTPVTPGAAPSTAAAIPQSSTGTTAPTQPSTDAAAPAADATTRFVAPSPDASATKSLVEQVLAALDEAKVESEKIRKYLPDFFKKLREDLENELRETREQASEATADTQTSSPASSVSSVVYAYQSVRQTSFSLSIRT